MSKFVNQAKHFWKRNGSLVLTCVGGVGVAATAVMAVKATPKALERLDQAEQEKGEELTKFEKVVVAGPAYIPAVVAGVSTVACIFGANALNKRQQAALMSAYALLDSSYKDYKNKVEELYGEGANEQVRSELAKEQYEDEGIEVEGNKQLFYDEFSERYFESTMDKVLNAEYQLNRAITVDGFAYLNEFYEWLEIPTVDYGDYLAWSAGEMYDSCWYAWVDFNHFKVTMDDGLEAIIVSMNLDPTFDSEDCY